MHDSAKLDKFLGKKVKITFFDNDIRIGVLQKLAFKKKPHIYLIKLEDPFIESIRFCKSHVKKIEEA